MNKSLVAGVDIGSVATKALILAQDNKVVSRSVSLTGANPKLVAEETLTKALASVGLSVKDLKSIVTTGYGRRSFESGSKAITEISCCAKGALWLSGNVRTIIDLGGQDTKVISLDDSGDVVDFVMNDKCAAGTGRFLEVMAGILKVSLEELVELSLNSKVPIKINSTCTVFAESEVISLIAQGKSKEDIVAGIHSSIAERVAGMVKQIGLKEAVFFCGGGAKNRSIHNLLEDILRVKIFVPAQPQFVVALGAALLAKEM